MHSDKTSTTTTNRGTKRRNAADVVGGVDLQRIAVGIQSTVLAAVVGVDAKRHLERVLEHPNHKQQSVEDTEENRGQQRASGRVPSRSVVNQRGHVGTQIDLVCAPAHKHMRVGRQKHIPVQFSQVGCEHQAGKRHILKSQRGTQTDT